MGVESLSRALGHLTTMFTTPSPVPGHAQRAGETEMNETEPLFSKSSRPSGRGLRYRHAESGSLGKRYPYGSFSKWCTVKQIQFSNLQIFKNSSCPLLVTFKHHEEDTESRTNLFESAFLS